MLHFAVEYQQQRLFQVTKVVAQQIDEVSTDIANTRMEEIQFLQKFNIEFPLSSKIKRMGITVRVLYMAQRSELQNKRITLIIRYVVKLVFISEE